MYEASGGRLCCDRFVSMHRLSGIASRAVLSLLVTAMSIGIAAGGQQSSGDSRTADSGIPLIHVNSDLVLVDALALDANGSPPPMLDAGDFALTEDGSPQTILFCSRDELPLSIVMLFDLTDSVQSQLKSLSAQALEFLSHLRPEDEVAVMTFSSGTKLLQPFTRDHAAIAAAVKEAAHAHSKEATLIDEVVYEAAQQARQSTIPNSRRVLLFFTDGTADPPTPLARKISPGAPKTLHTRAEAQHDLLLNGITVSAVIERSALTSASLVEQNVNPVDTLFSFAVGYRIHGKDFQHYADLTGGPYLRGNGKDSAQRMMQILDELRNRYTLGYRPHSSCAVGERCRITLGFSPHAFLQYPELKARHFRIATRAGYYRQ